MRVRERREPGARRRHQERAREAARRRAGSRDRSCGRSCERTAARAAKRGSPTPQQAVAAVARRGSAPVVRAAASAAATLARARRRAIWRPHTRARAVLARRGCARRERRVPARDLARRVRADIDEQFGRKRTYTLMILDPTESQTAPALGSRQHEVLGRVPVPAAFAAARRARSRRRRLRRDVQLLGAAPLPAVRSRPPNVGVRSAGARARAFALFSPPPEPRITRRIARLAGAERVRTYSTRSVRTPTSSRRTPRSARPRARRSRRS